MLYGLPSRIAVGRGTWRSPATDLAPGIGCGGMSTATDASGRAALRFALPGRGNGGADGNADRAGREGVLGSLVSSTAAGAGSAARKACCALRVDGEGRMLTFNRISSFKLRLNLP